jgi:hypothetical protein
MIWIYSLKSPNVSDPSILLPEAHMHTVKRVYTASVPTIWAMSFVALATPDHPSGPA